MPLSLESFPLPELQPGEALVRITCATICGSDLHTLAGRRTAPVPTVLGHEMVGIIAAAGEGLQFQTGERVTWSVILHCGECFYCQRGLEPKCERLLKFGHQRLEPGRELLGGMAEYCWLPKGTSIFRVPPQVPDIVASPANCATATVAAVLRQAGPLNGQTVTIHGAGMLGLTACAMAKTRGAAQVIAIEPNAERRAMASRFGATATLAPDSKLRDSVLHLSGGRGSDLALDFAGHPDVLETGLSLLRTGGHFVLAGAVFPAGAANIAPEQIVRRMLRITGVHNYSPQDLGAALEFLGAAGMQYPFAELVPVAFPLPEVNAAVEYANRVRPPRVALLP